MLGLLITTPAAATKLPKYIGCRIKEYKPETTKPLTSGVMLKLFRNESSPIKEIVTPKNRSKAEVRLNDSDSEDTINKDGKNEPSKEMIVGILLAYLRFGFLASSKSEDTITI